VIQKKFRHNLVTLPGIDRIDGDETTGRLYRLPDGSKVPSVTTVLGWSKKASLIEWRKRVGEEEANKISAKASSRGTKVHAICEDYLHNKTLDIKKINPITLDMFLSIKDIVDRIDDVLGIELQMFSQHLGVAGTSDVIANFDGRRSIIDFKTSSKPKKLEWIEDYCMQLAIYAVCFEELTGVPVNNLVVIIAVENSEPQLFIQKRDQWIGKAIDVINTYYDYHGLTHGKITKV
jgi:genome maintenance exonuclease 1